jgi:hypothetical protein
MSKIEPPLVEGEWVVAESRVDYPEATFTATIRGTVVVDRFGDLSIAGIHAAELAGWTILERRPPKPDWADADAILVTWAGSAPNQRNVFGKSGSAFGLTTVEEWVNHLRTGLALSITGLYPRDKS